MLADVTEAGWSPPESSTADSLASLAAATLGACQRALGCSWPVHTDALKTRHARTHFDLNNGALRNWPA